MPENKIRREARKRRAVMDRLSKGDTYEDAVKSAEKSLEDLAFEANENFMPRFNKLPQEQRARASELEGLVMKMLADNGVDEIESGLLMDDIMDHYSDKALVLLEGMMSGDLRYVTKNDYEAIKADYPLVDTE